MDPQNRIKQINPDVHPVSLTLMKKISNPLTLFLDKRLITDELIDQFLDDLEDEIFGIPNRSFYLSYKGDIKELIDLSEESSDDLDYEYQLLKALTIYARQRKTKL